MYPDIFRAVPINEATRNLHPVFHSSQQKARMFQPNYFASYYVPTFFVELCFLCFLTVKDRPFISPVEVVRTTTKFSSCTENVVLGGMTRKKKNSFLSCFLFNN